MKVFIIATLVGYGLLTARQVAVWHDELSLWSNAVKVAPGAERVHYNLAQAYRDRGDTARAELEMQQTLTLAYERTKKELGR